MADCFQNLDLETDQMVGRVIVPVVVILCLIEASCLPVSSVKTVQCPFSWTILKSVGGWGIGRIADILGKKTDNVDMTGKLTASDVKKLLCWIAQQFKRMNWQIPSVSLSIFVLWLLQGQLGTQYFCISMANFYIYRGTST